ncbi:MAG: hypothetical protein ABIW34_14630 [Ginsengibacter sp.]
MNSKNADILNLPSILEELTRTLLYEGYSLFPYHRSAIKNQKPVPFGVIYPKDYNTYNQHSHAAMQSECIVTGGDDLSINIIVRFLHLIKTEVLKQNNEKENEVDDVVAGWQTIEREINSGNLLITELIKNRKEFPIRFDKMNEDRYVYDDSDNVKAKRINSASEIKGNVIIEASTVENMKNTFRIRVNITNTSSIVNADVIARDEALCQSFLSTHIILKSANGEFISGQNPAENFKQAIAQCKNTGTWPILVDESNTTMLCSPIILYDHPQINPQSKGDLFDSTEIEEALMLHFAVMSDDEKNRIADSDEKLKAMLNKVGMVTPEEMIGLHGGMHENQNK